MSSMHAPRSANPVDAHVGMRMRMRRQILKLSQEKLGDMLGVTFQQVQKYERGANRVSASRLWKLSQLLEVPVSFFFEGLSGGVHAGHLAEGEQPEIINDFINSPDGIELARIVARIKSPQVRKQIIDLARSLATHQAPDTDNGTP